MGVIFFNERSSEDFGVVVEHPPAYEFPEKDYTSVHIPGRNGDVIFDTGAYKNTKRTYELAVGDLEKPLGLLANRMSEWLHSGDGYCRLEDTYEPDIFRLACFHAEGSLENIFDHAGRGTITFDCKPQRFYKSGEKAVSIDASSYIMKNGTFFIARPLIIIYGNGTFAINDISISIANVSNYIIIDSDLQDAYEIDSVTGEYINANNKVTLENGFPVLLPGDNAIQSSASISGVEVIPRWWTI